jgi:hypothetical protein
MNTIRARTAKTITLMAFLVVVLGWNHADAAPRVDTRPPSPASDLRPARQVHIEKILEVLAHKVVDPAFRTRAADKLATLNDRQLRLMATLSERVAVVGEGPAGSIALFLITALLILS